MCLNENSFFASDQFYSITLHCLTAIKVPLHILGGYIVIAKTPNKMSSLKNSMLSLHFISAFLDIYMSFLCVPVFTLPVSAGYPLGISLWIGIPTSVQVYIGCSLLSSVAVSILGSFEDRNYILRNGMNRGIRWKRIFYLTFLYVLSFTFMMPTFMIMPNQIEGKYQIIEKIPCLPRDILDRPGFFILAVDNTVCVYSITLEGAFLIAQLTFFIISIVCRLSGNNLKSKETYKLQRQFLFSLALHTLIPTMMLIFPVIYLALALSHNIYNQGATNLALTIVSLHGMLSTITMLIVHKPYRIATLLVFRISPSSSSKTNESRIWRTGAVGEGVIL